jgi:hypothetical protein
MTLETMYSDLIADASINVADNNMGLDAALTKAAAELNITLTEFTPAELDGIKACVTKDAAALQYVNTRIRHIC